MYFSEEKKNSGKLQIISGKLQNSGKFQNNAIDDVDQISCNHVIIEFDLKSVHFKITLIIEISSISFVQILQLKHQKVKKRT